jgi:LuxR family maltose regulon positive regulatory protein
MAADITEAWDVSLIYTKVVPPSLPYNFVRRAQLFDQLNVASKRLLTVVVAPAGSGKTTLMAEWSLTLMQRRKPVAWVSLDADDDKQQRLCAYLVAAFSRMEKPVGKMAKKLLDNDMMTPAQTIVSVLINEISKSDEEVFLFLDDADRLVSKSAREIISLIIKYAPRNLHIVFGMRTEPPFPIGLLDAREALLKIGAEDFRFSVEDATRFFQKNGDAALDHANVELLTNATEGWVAGLQLAALALRKSKDAWHIARGLSGSQFGIERYLDDALLSHLPEENLDFLLRTSILDRLNPGLCDAVMDAPGSSWSRLDWLERHNVFTRALDNERQWFRYHALLSDSLRRRAHQRFPEDEIRALHRRASNWFATQQHLPEAVEHALAAGDNADAARLAEACAMTMLARSDNRTLLNWIEQLPESLVKGRLHLAKAWALALSMNIAEAAQATRSIVAEISRLHGSAGDLPDEMLPPELNAVNAVIAALNDDSQRALELGRISARDPAPALPWVSRFADAVQLMGLMYEGKFDEVFRLRQLALVRKDTGTVPLYADVYRECMFGLAAILSGDFRQGCETFEMALASAERSLGHDSVAAAVPAGYMAGAYYELDNIERVRELVRGRTAITLASCPLGSASYHVHATARLYERDGAPGSALALLADAGQVATRRGWVRLRVNCDAEAVRILLNAGRIAEAENIARAADSFLLTQAGRQFGTRLDIRAAFGILRARILIAGGDAARAITLLSPLRQEAQSKERKYLELTVSTLLAGALEANGSIAEARDVSANAVIIAQSTGILNRLCDEGALALRALELVRQDTADYPALDICFLDRLITEIRHRTDPRPAPGLDRPASVHILSPRENAVLQHVALGSSNKEIGRQLDITPETVKWHLKNIFRKLNVSSRIEAIHAMKNEYPGDYQSPRSSS